MGEELGVYIWNISKPGLTSSNALKEINSVMPYLCGKNKQLDAIVVQIGIVDCTPRHTSRAFFIIKNKMGLFGKKLDAVVVFLKKLFRVSMRPWVCPKTFENNLASIIEISNKLSSKVVLISIFPPRKYMLHNVPKSRKWVDRYNKIIYDVVSRYEKEGVIFLDYTSKLPEGKVDAFVFEDGHHLSNCGHKYLFRCLSSVLVKESS